MFGESSHCAMTEPMKIPTPFLSRRTAELMRNATWHVSRDSCKGEPMKLAAPAHLLAYPHAPPGLFQKGLQCHWVSDAESRGHAGQMRGSLAKEASLACYAGAVGETIKSAKKEAADEYDSSDSTSCGDSESIKSSSRSFEDALIESGSEEPAHVPADSPASFSNACGLRLGALSLAERASIIIPVISEAAQLMGLTTSGGSIAQLQRLIIEHPATQERPKASLPTRVTSAELVELRCALKGLRLQELIDMLKPEEAPPSVQISIETLFIEMELEWAKSTQAKQRSKGKRGSARKQASRMKRAV